MAHSVTTVQIDHTVNAILLADSIISGFPLERALISARAIRYCMIESYIYACQKNLTAVKKTKKSFCDLSHFRRTAKLRHRRDQHISRDMLPAQSQESSRAEYSLGLSYGSRLRAELALLFGVILEFGASRFEFHFPGSFPMLPRWHWNR